MYAVIFANGEISNLAAAKLQLTDDYVLIAADGGTRHCFAMGLIPQILIGDMDSVSAEDLESLEEQGTQIIRHNPDKDETDLELALLFALEMGCEHALVLGGLGGRWDHTLANLLLPIHPKLAEFPVRFWEAGQTLFIIDQENTFNTQAGDTVSLIPLRGNAHGITTQGLQWSLTNETLVFGTTRGVSNRALGESVTIQAVDSILLCIHIERKSQGLNDEE